MPNTGAFPDEERPVNPYPPSFRARSLEEQVAILMKAFPLLRPPLRFPSVVEQRAKMPRGAEMWAAVPIYRSLGDYYGATAQMLSALEKKMRFRNAQEGKITADHLRTGRATELVLGDLRLPFHGDFRFVAIQFGALHRVKSPRRLREVLGYFEFGLGSFATGCLLLTHPERLHSFGKIRIDCVDDHFRTKADGEWNETPYFMMDVDRVIYSARLENGVDVDSFAPTGFYAELSSY